jgi:5-(carboxyamino)imidazole ribonucleotide mutase
MIQVAVIMGSASDEEFMSRTSYVLDHFGISHESTIMSAHRNPDRLDTFIREAQQKGVLVFIAAAGLAAHLAGAIASRTILPVIGVPLPAGDLKGMDALLSTVQMPSGIPVATMSIGKTGAENAAIMAARILALTDQKIAEKLNVFMKNGCRISPK